jgi:hypothetical protein
MVENISFSGFSTGPHPKDYPAVDRILDSGGLAPYLPDFSVWRVLQVRDQVTSHTHLTALDPSPQNGTGLQQNRFVTAAYSAATGKLSLRKMN